MLLLLLHHTVLHDAVEHGQVEDNDVVGGLAADQVAIAADDAGGPGHLLVDLFDDGGREVLRELSLWKRR